LRALAPVRAFAWLGFEGADWLPVKGANAQGGYLLGLCEGNQCEGGKVGREPGYGRVVVMEKVTRDNGGCTWRTAATLSLPKSLKFMASARGGVRGAAPTPVQRLQPRAHVLPLAAPRRSAGLLSDLDPADL
jgi:hypothetical protein